jgi:hypothetical protein
MPGVCGLDAAAQLHAELPEVRVLMLTTFNRHGIFAGRLAALSQGENPLTAASLPGNHPQPPVGDHAETRRPQSDRGDPGRRGTRLAVARAGIEKPAGGRPG